MSDASISPADPYPRKRLEAAGVEMAYVDLGQGDPIVFLHGNPTSSYLWRNIIPHLTPHARCLAPDLAGMGDSGKAADGSYRLADHIRYLDAWFAALDLGRQKVTLVIHDWGSALGFHWARRNPAAVKGIVYMEAIARPLKWSEWNDQARSLFQALRSPAGEDLILQRNIFIERILPGSVLRKLTDAENGCLSPPVPHARRVAAQCSPGRARSPSTASQRT